MRKLVYALTILTAIVMPYEAKGIGCLSGAAAGAVAGHMAHHGILGAIGGCVAGHEWHKHQVSQQSLQSTQDYVKQRQQYDPNYQDPWTTSSSTKE